MYVKFYMAYMFYTKYRFRRDEEIKKREKAANIIDSRTATNAIKQTQLRNSFQCRYSVRFVNRLRTLSSSSYGLLAGKSDK